MIRFRRGTVPVEAPRPHRVATPWRLEDRVIYDADNKMICCGDPADMARIVDCVNELDIFDKPAGAIKHLCDTIRQLSRDALD
jgi:hypothetical protein